MQKKLTKKTTPMIMAIAAFAVTASGVHAFGSTEILTKAGLSDDQVVAVQEAQELKASGNVTAAQETLKAAGVDRSAMKAIKDAAREAKKAVHAAVEVGDYDAFVIAATDSPLAEFVTSEAEFEQFVIAHALRQDGDRESSQVILGDLGIDTQAVEHRHGRHRGHGGGKAVLEQLTDEQREAFQVAKEANDHAAARAILAEAGVERPERNHRHQ